MNRSEEDHASDWCLVIKPHRSLSWQATRWFFLAIAALPIGIAVAFATQGLWLILPFAGLEVAFLGCCMYLVAKRGQRRELVACHGDFIRVQKGWIRRAQARSGPEETFDFQRYWTSVVLVDGGVGHSPRLLIGASGKRVELGGFLTNEERVALYDRLQVLLKAKGSTIK